MKTSAYSSVWTSMAATLACILSLALSSCQKSPINGDLDGQWQVMEVTPAPENLIIDDRIYYCFYLHTCQLTQYGGVFTAGNMIFDGNRLNIDFPYAKSPTSVAKLKQYGIYSNPVTFNVEHLDKKSLVLRDGNVKVSLRKF